MGADKDTSFDMLFVVAFSYSSSISLNLNWSKPQELEIPYFMTTDHQHSVDENVFKSVCLSCFMDVLTLCLAVYGRFISPLSLGQPATVFVSKTQSSWGAPPFFWSPLWRDWGGADVSTVIPMCNILRR